MFHTTRFVSYARRCTALVAVSALGVTFAIVGYTALASIRIDRPVAAPVTAPLQHCSNAQFGCATGKPPGKLVVTKLSLSSATKLKLRPGAFSQVSCPSGPRGARCQCFKYQTSYQSLTLSFGEAGYACWNGSRINAYGPVDTYCRYNSTLLIQCGGDDTVAAAKGFTCWSDSRVVLA
jgi:hypothetical protein